MLLHGRVDSVIVNEDQGEYFISMLGIRDKVEKAFYEYNDDTFRYIGISKKSVHLDKLPEFESAMQNIVESGKWDEIMNEYFFIKHGIPTDAFRWK
jgi:ABC-type amino acid transport substrate-binding protein